MTRARIEDGENRNLGAKEFGFLKGIRVTWRAARWSFARMRRETYTSGKLERLSVSLANRSIDRRSPRQ